MESALSNEKAEVRYLFGVNEELRDLFEKEYESTRLEQNRVEDLIHNVELNTVSKLKQIKS